MRVVRKAQIIPKGVKLSFKIEEVGFLTLPLEFIFSGKGLDDLANTLIYFFPLTKEQVNKILKLWQVEYLPDEFIINSDAIIVPADKYCVKSVTKTVEEFIKWFSMEAKKASIEGWLIEEYIIEV